MKFSRRALVLIPHVAHAFVSWAQQAATLVLSSPVQGGLVIVNVYLVQRALSKLRKARFIATVRVVRDLTDNNRKEDLELLLDRLPPWIQFSDWERAESFQAFLTLLWPALNIQLCKMLKDQIEPFLKQTPFGEVAITKLSFGRQPPSIVGIKPSSYKSHDSLAMTLDMDVHWAGEPDMVLRLIKIGGASVALQHVHIACLLQVIIPPIRDDPPFVTGIKLSMKRQPYIDFSIKALGGLDIMALPAIRSWLLSTVISLANGTIVYPKVQRIKWVPDDEEEERRKRQEEGDDVVSEAIAPPLGVLVVEVHGGEIERRRSTFLGRWKLANPRVAMVLPHNMDVSAPLGVMQAGLTAVRKQTLQPVWRQTFTFAVTSKSQVLKLLLSHQRLEFLGADMPLGSAEIRMMDVLGEADGMDCAVSLQLPAIPRQMQQQQQQPHGGDITPPFVSPSKVLSRASTFYESASSGDEEEATSGGGGDLTRLFSAVGAHKWADGDGSSFSEEEEEEVDSQEHSGGSSMGEWEPDETETEETSAPPPPITQAVGVDISPQPGPSAPVQLLRRASVQFADSPVTIPDPSPASASNKDLHWLAPDGVWVEVNPTASVTLAGMLEGAVRADRLERTSTTLHSASMKDGGAGWLGSLQQHLLGGHEEDLEDWEASTPSGMKTGRLLVKIRWAATAATPQRIAASPSKRVRRQHSRTEQQNQEEAAAATAVVDPPPAISAPEGAAIPAPLPTPLPIGHLGILAVRVAYTKLDYGQQLTNPILALGMVPKKTRPTAVTMEGGAGKWVPPKQRVISMDCSAGARPGLLHWNQVFYLPVEESGAKSMALIQLGNASSSLKLSSYGTSLYCLDACESFDGDVAVEACVHVPLQRVMLRGTMRDTLPLMEARGLQTESMDVGRVVLQLSWFPTVSLPSS